MITGKNLLRGTVVIQKNSRYIVPGDSLIPRLYCPAFLLRAKKSWAVELAWERGYLEIHWKLGSRASLGARLPGDTLEAGQ